MWGAWLQVEKSVGRGGGGGHHRKAYNHKYIYVYQ